MTPSVPHYVSVQTIAFLFVFLIVYLVFLLRRTSRDGLDLYDFLMLSTIAIVPVGFILFPNLVLKACELLGVAFPFILLFATLFLLLYLFVLSLVIRIHRMQKRFTSVVQDLALNNLERRSL